MNRMLQKPKFVDKILTRVRRIDVVDIYSLTYVSTCSCDVDADEMKQLLSKAAAFNNENDITGVLLCDGTNILQQIEGKRETVEALAERIKADDRHHSFAITDLSKIPFRKFSGWSALMCFGDSCNDSNAMLHKIRSILQKIYNQ